MVHLHARPQQPTVIVTEFISFPFPSGDIGCSLQTGRWRRACFFGYATHLALGAHHAARSAAEGRPPSRWTHHSARCAAYHLLRNKPYFVRAEWDDEAAVWVASSDDVPGLVTEAATLEALDTKLRSMVPELLEANGCMPADGQVAVELLARRFSVALPAAG